MKTIFTLALILLSSFAQAADFTITVQPAGGGSGANTNLSNLTYPTSVNLDLLPQDTNGQSIGRYNKFWARIYGGTYFAKTIVVQPSDPNGAPDNIGAIREGSDLFNGTLVNSSIVLEGIKTGIDGNVAVRTANTFGTANTANTWIITGNNDSTANTGNVNISTGTTPSGVRGLVNILGTSLNLNSNKITNLATPTAATDAATKEYVDSASGGGSGPSVSSEIVQATCGANDVCTITLNYTPKMVFYIAVKMASNSKLFNFTVSNTVTEISQAQALGINGPSFVVNEQQKTLTFLPKDAIGTNAVISNGLLQNYTQVRYLH